MDFYHYILELIDAGDWNKLVDLVDCDEVKQDKGYFLLRYNDAFHPTCEVLKLISAGYPPRSYVSRLIDDQMVGLLETVLHDYNVKLDGCNLDKYYRLETTASKDLTNIIKRYTTPQTIKEYDTIVYGDSEQYAAQEKHFEYLLEEKEGTTCIYCDKYEDVCVCDEICYVCRKYLRGCICYEEEEEDWFEGSEEYDEDYDDY